MSRLLSISVHLIRTLVIAFFLSVCIQFGYSQDYTVTNYSVSDGLAQSTVYSIYEDHNGFMWFSTMGGGVSRFDGVNFKSYDETNGLISNQVYCIFEDSKNNIWFGSRGGLTKYDGYSFKSYTVDDGLSNNIIRCIAEDSKGHIWLGTFGGGLSVLSDNETIITFHKDQGLLSNFVYDLIFVDENLFIATKAGLCKLNINNKKFINLALAGTNIRDIAVNQDTTSLLIAAESKGLYKLDLKSSAISNLRTSPKNISFIHETLSQLWLSTLDDGLYLVTDSSEIQFTQMNSGLASNVILTIHEDVGGDIWIGTLGGGVSKLNLTPMFSYHKEDWLNEDAVQSIFQDPQGVLWFGCRYGGIKTMDSTHYDLTRFKNMNVTGIRKFSDEKIWISTNNNGLFCIDTDENVEIFNQKTGFPSDKVFAMEEDASGNLWLGSYDEGVIILNKSNKTFHKLKEFDSKLVFDIVKTSTGELWIATNGNGIYVVNNGTVTNKFDISHGLPSNDIWSLTEDIFGNIWIGMNGGGVSVYNGKSFVNYNTEDGTISDNVHSILFDNANNLWIGTEKGVDKLIFNLKDTLGKVSYQIYEIEHYGKEEGLFGIETNLNASFKDKSGYLWFGSVNGATKFNPQNAHFDHKEPQIHITDIRIHFDTVNWEQRYKGEIEPWSHLPKELKLRSFENHVTFEYMAITADFSAKTKYKVMLEGLNDEWSKPISETKVTYTNLSPGDYVFKILACNKDGVWTSSPTSYSFSIRTPFYKMPLFYIIAGAAGLFALWYLDKRKSYKTRKEKLLLEKEILEQTMELRMEKNNVELRNIEIVAQKRELEIKQQELEVKNTQIMDSINYAKRLQRTILVNEDLFNEKFAEHFILLKPKDIVSGDFFWIRESEHFVYFSAVDCTGHGVPGAFMSIVCNRLLNMAVDEYEFNDAGKMLQYLHNQLLHMMRPGLEERMRDGMDLALCIIDKKNNDMSFAGAHNPLFLYRDGELTVVDADKKHVGFAFRTKKDQTFTNHKIELKQGDQLYMFTDGYSDQFGGNDKRKYFQANFQKFIANIAISDMDTQYNQLVNEFLDWKGEHEQIDDVLVMGVKIK